MHKAYHEDPLFSDRNSLSNFLYNALGLGASRWSPGTYVSDDVALVTCPYWELTSGSEI